ncbi:MAG: hypothetical protein DMG49_01240 [Acidobacteria bacterium]|nr:MAG: hypothetical protein DMG49_01240 [Acidobacteriota bacterium]
MICPSCHAEVGEGKGFCGKCGATLRTTPPSSLPATSSLRCSRCGSEVASGKKFCSACGNPVGERPAPTVSSKAAAHVFSPSEAPKNTAASQARVSTPPALSTPPRVRARRPINWRKVRIAVGIPVLLTGLVLTAWYFLPREPLAPERLGTILDRATAGTFLTFNDGAPGRQTLVLSSENDIWEISTRESVYHGPILGYFFSPDGKVVLDNLSLYDWRSKKRTMLENPAP